MLIPDPMTLIQQPAPFNDPNWIFEIKHDGFRAFAVPAAMFTNVEADRRSNVGNREVIYQPDGSHQDVF
jgi:hypothetical protein